MTTKGIGHDGLGVEPGHPRNGGHDAAEQLAGLNGRPDVDWNWNTITSYLDRFEAQVETNIAMLVPHGTNRMAVMGMENRAPSPDEMNQPSNA